MSDDNPASPGAYCGEALDVTALTRGLVRGDDAAYGAFHAAYFPRLLRYLLVVARGDELAARDAMQGAMMRMVRHAKVFSDEAVFWSWLTVLARSAFADESRKRRRYFAFLERFRFHVNADFAGEENLDADARLEGVLAECTAGLDEQDRSLIEWKYSEHASVRVIAARLGSTEKAVESKLTRVRQRLRAAMLQKLNNENA